MRRETPHPCAQLSLFDTIEGKRHTALITDQIDDVATLATDLVESCSAVRAHAPVISE